MKTFFFSLLSIAFLIFAVGLAVAFPVNAENSKITTLTITVSDDAEPGDVVIVKVNSDILGAGKNAHIIVMKDDAMVRAEEIVPQ